MRRRTLLKLLPAAMLAGNTRLFAAKHSNTKWIIKSQEGLDACLLLGILSAPSLQAEAYPEERNYWLPRLNKAEIEALARVRKALDAQRALVGPFVALLASAAPTDSLEKVIASFTNQDTIKDGLKKSEFWEGEEAWKETSGSLEDIATVLHGLKNGDFSAYWKSKKKKLIDSKVKNLYVELMSTDLVGMQQRYTSRKLIPQIEIYVSALSEPHGIRIIGQRFLTSYRYPSKIVKQNAAHEIFHPFLKTANSVSDRVIARLSADPLLIKIDARADKSDGYGTISGLVEEGMVQALEAVVSINLGFEHRDMAIYWREQDNGIHVFAAAAFHVMRMTGFSKRGGDALQWLDVQVANGNLYGSKLVRHAEMIIGTDAVNRWL
jgi:hypothetical protein